MVYNTTQMYQFHILKYNLNFNISVPIDNMPSLTFSSLPTTKINTQVELILKRRITFLYYLEQK